jgi:hypothetical protein
MPLWMSHSVCLNLNADEDGNENVLPISRSHDNLIMKIEIEQYPDVKIHHPLFTIGAVLNSKHK